MTLSRRLVAALYKIRGPPLPAAVARAARLHLLDAVGVGLAAAATKMGASYRGVARELAGSGDASVFGTERTASADVAALINGGLIHSLEYDDTHTARSFTAVRSLLPRALAVGQIVGRVRRRYAWRLRARVGDFRAARPCGARANFSARDFRSHRPAARWSRRWSRRISQASTRTPRSMRSASRSASRRVCSSFSPMAHR